MRRGAAPLLAAAALLLLAAPAQGADYVGLGDSYSSGTGTDDGYTGNCQRTPAAYPSLIDPQLSGTGVNLSCSGARTQHITTDAQTPENPVPQIAVTGALTSGTDFVTLQIGGNDAGFVDTLVECGNPFGDCDAAIEEAEQTATVELPPKLNATYDAVRAAAPNATIAVVGYPRIFRPNQTCNTFFSSGEVNDLNAAADLLSESIRLLAQARNLAYIDPRQAFIGHGACDSVEWINGLSFSTTANSYHPKAVGHSSGYGPLVLSGIQGIPNTNIISAPAAQSNTASPQFQFTSTPAASSFQCKLDGGSFSSCSSPKQFAGLSEGSHTVQVRGVNSAGNVDQFPDSHTWTVDTVAPGLTLEPGGPTGTVSSDSAAFSFSADAGAALTCRLDAGSFGTCASPKTYTDLADGPHSFTVRATDTAGNVTSASRSWTVDTAPPVATINDGPADPTSAEDVTIDFSVDDPAATVLCELDGDEVEPCESPVELTGLADGPHTFTVQAADPVGNVSELASYSWEQDSQAPEVSIDDGPPALSNQDSAHFEFTAALLTTTTCSLDGAAPALCVNSAAYDELDDGEHTFTVTATDLASNFATDTYSWTVDTTAPPATIDSGPPALTAETSAELAFSSEDASATFECRLDSNVEGDFEACEPPVTYSALSNGPHDLDVRAVDAAGNAGPPASRAWTVDTTPPTASINSGPSAPVAQNTATFGFSSNEGGSSFQCRIDGGDFQPCTSTQTYPGLSDGSHTFEVKATDSVGNAGSAVSRSWSIDTAAPTVTFDEGPDQIVASASADFEFHASEAGSDFECRLDSGQPGDFFACSSPRHYGGLGDGPHTLEVRAIDALGNEGPPAAYAWNSDTVTPTTSIDTGPTGQVSSDEAGFTFSASESGDFQCRIDGGAYEGCVSPHGYTGLGEGPHTFQVKFTDAGQRQATDSQTWTVDTVAPTVTLSGGPTGTVASSLATIGFSVSGGGPAQCSWDSEPFAPCGSSPASRSGLPDGPHELRVRSTDSAGNTGSATRNWTVDRTPPDTTIDIGPSGTVTSGDATFEFSSEDGTASFQCSLDGSVFASCSSPKAHTGLGAGDHTFRVRSTDPVGNTDTSPAARTWRVEPAPSGGGVQGQVKKKPKCKKKKGRKKKCKKRP